MAAAAWERQGSMEAFRGYAFGSVTQADRAIYDTIAALVVHGVFRRHPNARVCSIENGSEWVAPLVRKLGKCQGQFPQLFHEPVDDTLRRHVFVAPYYEDDVRELAGFGTDEVRRIMRENQWRLVTPQHPAPGRLPDRLLDSNSFRAARASLARRELSA